MVARDGEERLAIARREHPDLIILDLMLPRLDGLEVCRAIRCECDVPVIMLTARESEIGRLVGLELGADSREDQRLYRIPPSGIDRGMGGAPKGIRITVASVLCDTRTTKLLTLLGEEFSAGRVGALFFGECLPQLFDHQKGVAVHRFGVVFEDLYWKAVLPDGRVDIHGHRFGRGAGELWALALPSHSCALLADAT